MDYRYVIYRREIFVSSGEIWSVGESWGAVAKLGLFSFVMVRLRTDVNVTLKPVGDDLFRIFRVSLTQGSCVSSSSTSCESPDEVWVMSIFVISRRVHHNILMTGGLWRYLPELGQCLQSCPLKKFCRWLLAYTGDSRLLNKWYS
jgi:hypothetical protein